MHNKYCSSLVAQNRRKYRGKRYITTAGKKPVEIHTNIGKIHKNKRISMFTYFSFVHT